MPPSAPVVVIGAGMAGLSAARRLVDAGRRVVVVDKGRGVGGRVATRRMGEAVADHGAQFFTVRSDELRSAVDGWGEAGVVREWCRGFRQPADGHPRYVGAGGMTALPKHLAAGLDVRSATRVAAVAPGPTDRPEGGAASGDGRPGGWVVRMEGGHADLAAAAVVITCPVPQTLALLGAGGAMAHVGSEAAGALDAVAYSPTLAAMVTLDGTSAVDPPGGVQLEGGLLSWVGDNQAKGASPVPCLTLHASPEASADLWDAPAEEVLAAMTGAAARWIGGAAVLDAQLARWRYAQPTSSHDGRCLVAVDGPWPVVCAGDAFGEAKVEGATRSGWAAADALLAQPG